MVKETDKPRNLVLSCRPSLRKMLWDMVRRAYLFIEDVLCWIVAGVGVFVLLIFVLWLLGAERVIEGKKKDV